MSAFSFKACMTDGQNAQANFWACLIFVSTYDLRNQHLHFNELFAFLSVVGTKWSSVSMWLGNIVLIPKHVSTNASARPQERSRQVSALYRCGSCKAIRVLSALKSSRMVFGLFFAYLRIWGSVEFYPYMQSWWTSIKNSFTEWDKLV